MRWPTPTEPVKLTAVMPGWLTKASPIDAARAHDEVEHTGGDAAAVDDVGQRPGAAGHQICRLQDHAVAIGQCRRDLPRRDRDREVPRSDQADHAQRLAGDFHADAGRTDGNVFTGAGAGIRRRRT